jgi:hypothetical protein
MNRDLRKVSSGQSIPKENYCDQPYIVITNDGNWLCVLTTGPGLESQEGQHVVAAISSDQGEAWSDLIDIEPSTEHMSSWVTALVVPYGRVYAIYDYNFDGGATQHGGWLCYRCSDDNGRTWSSERYRIPMRRTKRDYDNVSGGKYQYFWCIDKPVTSGGSVFFGLPKLASGVPLDGGEGWVVCSDNILTETVPERIQWHLYPDGDIGVVNPELGSVQEEQNIEVLGDGTLYMVNRTQTGYPSYALSRDQGHTWTVPQVMRYANSRPIKNPRACPRIWKARNGKFLFWFHNNSYPGWGNSANRNPVWLSGGVERDGEILWSQPEILLYSADPTIIGMSYPDFVEQDGRIWVSETQKMVARVHEIDQTLLEGLWTQRERHAVTREGLVYESTSPLTAGDSVNIPALPSLSDGSFTLEIWLLLTETTESQVVIDSFGQRRRGFRVSTAAHNALELELHDGNARRWLEVIDGADPSQNVRSLRHWRWTTDQDVIEPGELHHVVFIVDGLAKVVSIVVDGILCDGGEARIQGWWRLNPYLDELNDDFLCKVGDGMMGQVSLLRIYDRYLRTSEAVSNYRAGPAEGEASR